MVTPAPFTILPLTTTTTTISATNTNNVKKTSHESPLSSPQQSTDDSVDSSLRTISTFRIPKLAKSNGNTSPTDNNQLPSSLGIKSIPSSSTQVSQVNSNSQPVKRKLSINQYKDKRLKSTDTTENYAADVDMRVNPTENVKNSPPTFPENNSPKANDIRQDVILKSNLSEPGVKKLIKKKLIWADEQNQPLVHTSIFEVDESEMVDMHAFKRQCVANISIAQIEKLMERDLCQRRNFQENQSMEMDDRQNLPPLPKLIRILLPGTIPIPVVKSQERNEQEEREKTVLQALLMRSFLPHSPGEPDGDLHGQISNERIEPKTIPLDDSNPSTDVKQNSPVHEMDSSSTNASITPSATTTTTTIPGLSSLSLDKLSPEVAQIIAQAKEKTAAAANTAPATILPTPISQSVPMPTINPIPTPVTNLTIPSNLLSLLMNLPQPITNPSVINPPMNPVVNLPLNLNVPSPSPLVISQLAAALGLLPPATVPVSANPIFSPATMNTMTNSSPVHFAPQVSQPRPRFNQNKKDHYAPNVRGNHHGRIYRRGLHNNNTNRRDHSGNRNPNRNIYS